MLPSLRPHQAQDLEVLRAEVRAGRDPLLVAPCGYGKGHIITFIVQSAVSRGHHVIFAVHGKSLVQDMHERVEKLGIPHGILMGGERRARWHKVQIASIDTLYRMSHPPKASLIIVDEAHMSLSPTWRKALGRYPAARVIGMTATPIRLDGKGLGRATGGLFDSMVVGPSEEDLIAMGYLVGSRVLAPPPPSMAGVKKTAGEFNQKELASVCDKTRLIGDIVAHWKKHAHGRKTNAFAIDQAHAAHIAEQFNISGVPWAYVDAATSLDERARIYRDYDESSGKLMGISSVGCAAIGWDHPICSCLIAARPTASMGLWRQMLGRGSRPLDGKQNFLVLDHAGNTHRHAPFGMFEDSPTWSLDGSVIKELGKKPPSVTTCKRCYATFRTGPRECPYCGVEIRVVPKKVEVEAGELGEIIRTEQAPPAREGDKELYLKLLSKAANRGYKPGHAAFQFKGIRKYWPPKAWQEEGHAV